MLSHFPNRLQRDLASYPPPRLHCCVCGAWFFEASCALERAREESGCWRLLSENRLEHIARPIMVSHYHFLRAQSGRVSQKQERLASKTGPTRPNEIMMRSRQRSSTGD